MPVNASVEMIKCCEQFLTDDDIDCNHMRLDGSRVMLKKNSITNCTLIYPNAYPLNRKGVCNVNITLYDSNQCNIMEFIENIPFDTTIKPQDIMFLFKKSFLNIDKQFRLCESKDEDPADLCEPVNCHMKYRGSKSWFDPIKRQCVPIPVCDNSKPDSSNIVYDPYSNTCITLANDISIKDIDSVLYETQDLRPINKTKKSYQSNIRCHHGKMDEINKLCICHDGWKSAQNLSFPIVSTVPIHMCTIQINNNIISKYLPIMKKMNSTNWVSF
ncbi:Hypothetical protein CINCED_3A006051 [Cinara cedri]|uniref:Uncharacterized protein n=1 Tax=Cinara cedri TaxID=506608 RepID=A0A5E4MQ05_9HEMI|nr:Hypothetical protein CINCED_3A006051 [Cinara cedri]